MSQHKFMWVDAFTDKAFGGNPCAVIFDSDSLSEEQMFKIAKETNLSETAFILKSKNADFAARYFTPAEEIPLAGHPTISTIYSLIQAGQIKPQSQSISLELPAGIVNIDIIFENHMLQRIVMSQLKPQFMRTHDRGEVAPLFGLTENDLLEIPPQTVSTGTPQLMVPVKNLDILKNAKMNVEAYLSYKANSDFFSPHLFCLQGITENGTTFARHFGVPPDTLEDPFTGSATGGMAAYLWHNNLISDPQFIAEQGHWMGRPGQAFVKVIGSKESIETVMVGGLAVKIMEGQVEIP